MILLLLRSNDFMGFPVFLMASVGIDVRELLDRSSLSREVPWKLSSATELILFPDKSTSFRVVRPANSS